MEGGTLWESTLGSVPFRDGVRWVFAFLIPFLCALRVWLWFCLLEWVGWAVDTVWFFDLAMVIDVSWWWLSAVVIVTCISSQTLTNVRVTFSHLTSKQVLFFTVFFHTNKVCWVWATKWICRAIQTYAAVSSPSIVPWDSSGIASVRRAIRIVLPTHFVSET